MVKLIWHWKPCCFNSPPAVQNAYLFICFISYEIVFLIQPNCIFTLSLFAYVSRWLNCTHYSVFFPFSSQLEQPHLLPWFSKVLAPHQPLPLRYLIMLFALLACLLTCTFNISLPFCKGAITFFIGSLAIIPYDFDRGLQVLIFIIVYLLLNLVIILFI